MTEKPAPKAQGKRREQGKTSPAARPPPPLIVGIGASAGGLAAFRSFFSNMPADTGMTFVLVQHLDPNHHSMLVELLAPHVAMPVTEARDGMKMQGNHVYVIPPNATLTFEDGYLRVSKPAPVRAYRRPIDTLFVSLAENHNECAVGIVLSGVGSDGSLGLGTIKERGGLTLAQAEFDSSPMSGMPHSAVATGLVDIVVSVETMPAKLTDYQRHLLDVAEQKGSDGTRHDASAHLSAITSALRQRINHDFSGYKEKTLTRRVQRRMQVLQIESFPAYVEFLRKDPQEGEALFRELLIGVTEFFRDPEAFQALKANVIPSLLAAKRDGDALRVWVPGCATGEEVYSVAILLKEVMGLRQENPRVTIFGTDIDADAVAFARSGRYRKFAGLSSERQTRWFVKDGDDYCPVPAIRDMCVFSVHSLVKDPPFSKLDLISCRNVLIYLGADFQNRVMQTFHYALTPGGYLFLGPSESGSRDGKLFNVVDKKHRILQRREGHQPALPAFHSGLKPDASIVPIGRAAPAEDSIARSASRAMEKYAPAYFVIDGNYEILRFSGGEAGLYLEPSAGAASLNLFTILRKDLRSGVRAAIQEALARQKSVVNGELSIEIAGERRGIVLIAEPLAEHGADSKLCVVGLRQRDPPVRAGGKSGAAKTSASNGAELQRELHTLRLQLQTARDEMETYIEENKSATEEFQSVNEELQSSNEELETAKEEMQSVNEELQTINNELNSKNEALLQTNSDLKNLLDSTQIATVFLDDDLRIKNFTPAMTDLFPLRPGDRGRALTDFVTSLKYDDLRRDVTDVQRKLSVIERELTLKDGAATFVMRIRPYRTMKNVIDGVVITFVDVTDRKHQVDHLDFLMREMSHRTNNLLAVVQSMAHQTGRTSGSYAEFTKRFNDRILGLAASNNLLVSRDFKGVDLEQLVRAQLQPFIEADSTRVETSGPSLAVNADAVQALGLVLHELATNAAKHGALSIPKGALSIRWELYDGKTEPRFRMVWEERGGPPVKAPTRTGFGSFVLNQMTQKVLSAETKTEFLSDGVSFILACPSDRVQDARR